MPGCSYGGVEQLAGVAIFLTQHVLVLDVHVALVESGVGINTGRSEIALPLDQPDAPLLCSGGVPGRPFAEDLRLRRLLLLRRRGYHGPVACRGQ